MRSEMQGREHPLENIMRFSISGLEQLFENGDHIVKIVFFGKKWKNLKK